MNKKITIKRVAIDDAGYAFRFEVKRGREVLGSFVGNQLDPQGMSIGRAEAAAIELKKKIEAEKSDGNRVYPKVEGE